MEDYILHLHISIIIIIWLHRIEMLKGKEIVKMRTDACSVAKQLGTASEAA